MYITTFLFFLGVSITSASWTFLLVAIIIMVGAVLSLSALKKSSVLRNMAMFTVNIWIGYQDGQEYQNRKKNKFFDKILAKY